MSSDNVSTLSLRLESDRFDAGLRYSQTLMKGLGQESIALLSTLKLTAGAIGSLFVGNKVVQGFVSATHAASAYREDLAQFDHVMRNVTKTANDMVKTLTSDAFGRTSMQARQMLMGMTSLAKGMGMTDKAAVELSGAFSKMAIDMGSFQMRDPDAIMGAFQSALMGNTMALRSYQVHLSEATLKETIAVNAKKGMVFASDRQARAYAVLTEAQKQQADAIGDYAVEAANFGNQLRKFYGGLSEIAPKIGKGLLEPANEFLKVANSIIDKFLSLDDASVQAISRATALGVGIASVCGAYKVLLWAVPRVSAALSVETVARQAATAAATAQRVASGQLASATASATAATMAETAALTANTVARTANAKAAVASRVATMDRWNTSVAKARVVAGSGFGNMPSSRDEKMFLWNSNVSGAKDETAARMRHRQMMMNRWDSKVAAARNTGRTGTATDALAVNVLGTGSWRDKKITHRNVTSQHGASRRSRAYINAMAIKRRGNARKRQHLYNAPTRGLRRAGRGISAIARATVGRLPGAGLITGFVKQIGGVIVRLAPTFFTRLGTMALTAINPIGWGVAILTGLSVVGNYLPTLMYKAYDGFVSLFSPENMRQVWEWFKDSAITAFNGTIEYLGKGLYGIGLVAESILYTAINALGNGLGAMIKTVTLGAVDIGKFEYKSSGYVAYEQQKQTNEMQARLDDQRAEQAKREKQIAEFRSKVSEQERKWLEQESENLKKRSDLASGRFDSFAKADSIGSKLHFAESLTSGIDFAIQSVQRQMEEAGYELERIIHSGGSEETRAAALEKYHAAEARMDALQKQKSANSTGIAEMRYSLFDAQFENAGKQKGTHAQLGAYTAMMDSPHIRLNLARQRQVESEHHAAQQELNTLLQEQMFSRADADDERSGLLMGEIENAKRRVAESETAYNELQAALSDQQKLQDRMDELKKEQEKRYQEAQSNLWNFNFDHAPKSVQQQMARKSFFKAQNQFEGARTDEERDKALQDMQTMYGKIDHDKAAEMPAWNGFLRTTAGAVESNSVAAQELQERILNDFNKVMIDEAKKQSVMQAAMKAAMEQVVKNTDPNQQPSVGGYA